MCELAENDERDLPSLAKTMPQKLLQEKKKVDEEVGKQGPQDLFV